MREPRDRWPDTSRPDGTAGAISALDWPPFNPKPKLEQCLALRHATRPWLLTIWEPLETKAPSPAHARPYCCLLDTVIFYHREYLSMPPRPWRDRDGKLHPSTAGTLFEWARATMRLARVELVQFQGQAFERHGGRVLWRRRAWWVVYGAHRGTRAARQANGVPLDGPSWPGEVSNG